MLRSLLGRANATMVATAVRQQLVTAQLAGRQVVAGQVAAVRGGEVVLECLAPGFGQRVITHPAGRSRLAETCSRVNSRLTW